MLCKVCKGTRSWGDGSRKFLFWHGSIVDHLASRKHKNALESHSLSQAFVDPVPAGDGWPPPPPPLPVAQPPPRPPLPALRPSKIQLLEQALLATRAAGVAASAEALEIELANARLDSARAEVVRTTKAVQEAEEAVTVAEARRLDAITLAQTAHQQFELLNAKVLGARAGKGLIGESELGVSVRLVENQWC